MFIATGNKKAEKYKNKQVPHADDAGVCESVKTMTLLRIRLQKKNLMNCWSLTVSEVN